MLTDYRVTAYIKEADAILRNAAIIICAFKGNVLRHIIHFFLPLFSKQPYLFAFNESIEDPFTFELCQYLQHVDAYLLRIIVQTGTDDAEAVRCQYPAMQLVGLVLLVLLIFLIGYLLHGILRSASQTGTSHPETARRSVQWPLDRWDRDGGCCRTPRYETRSD